MVEVRSFGDVHWTALPTHRLPEEGSPPAPPRALLPLALLVALLTGVSLHRLREIEPAAPEPPREPPRSPPPGPGSGREPAETSTRAVAANR